MKSVLSPFAVLLALLALPALASAQADQADPDFDRGVESLRTAHYADAETAFRASLAAAPRAATYCNLALTYERWGDHRREAAAAYEDCAEADDSGRFRAHALERASTIRAELRAERAVEPPNPFGENGPPDGEVDPPETGPATHDREQTDTSYALLGAGIGATAVGVALVSVAAALAGKGRDDVAWLDANVGPPPATVQAGTEAADRLESADQRRRQALGLYVGGALVGAAGMILIAVDLIRPREITTVVVQPVSGGAVATATVRF